MNFFLPQIIKQGNQSILNIICFKSAVPLLGLDMDKILFTISFCQFCRCAAKGNIPIIQNCKAVT